MNKQNSCIISHFYHSKTYAHLFCVYDNNLHTMDVAKEMNGAAQVCGLKNVYESAGLVVKWTVEYISKN